MGVRKRGNGIYQYRFVVAGRAYSESTGTADRREAERIEADAKRAAQAQVRAAATAKGPSLTLGQALTRFWDEVGTDYTGTYRKTVWGALEWLRHESLIGEDTRLCDITGPMITQAIARRRGEGVSNATINRTVTEPLRRIFRRARNVWDLPVKSIEWKEHLRPEPKERIRALTSEEEVTLFASIPGPDKGDFRALIGFLLKSGFRKREAINLRQRDIDWKRGRISVLGKGNKPSSIPLSAELRAILEPLRAPKEFVFHFVADRTSKGRTVGERYPITYEGIKTMWRRYARSVLTDFRMHDLRHTAATRLGRHTNIKTVQRFMRHEDVATTAKYLHAFDDDVLAAMEAESAGTANR
jgi:integrase